MSYISSYCHITSESISINGENVFHSKTEGSTLNELFKSIYVKLNLEYPKFYKMDVLSKLSFLGVEILKKQSSSFSNYGDDEITLLFSNKTSSAATDKKFLESYQNGGTPSPSLFVYTLPNILMGEIAIRNKWYGENLFAVLPHFDPAFFDIQCKIAFTRTAKACICGWIEVANEKIDAFLFLAEKNKLSSTLALSQNSIELIYNTHPYGKSKRRIEEANH